MGAGSRFTGGGSPFWYGILSRVRPKSPPRLFLGHCRQHGGFFIQKRTCYRCAFGGDEGTESLCSIMSFPCFTNIGSLELERSTKRIPKCTLLASQGLYKWLLALPTCRHSNFMTVTLPTRWKKVLASNGSRFYGLQVSITLERRQNRLGQL